MPTSKGIFALTLTRVLTRACGTCPPVGLPKWLSSYSLRWSLTLVPSTANTLRSRHRASSGKEAIAHADCVGLGPPELGHPVVDVAGDQRLDTLRLHASRSHAITEDHSESEERVLDSSLSGIADLLLLVPSPDFADSTSSSIASPRYSTSDGCCLAGWDDDPRISVLGGRVECP